MKVLITPMDWGLGHATRCIPVIQELISQGCEPVIAGSGASLDLLRDEFPNIRTYALPGYNPRYANTDRLAYALARQVPRFLKVIRAEQHATREIVRRENIAAIISDNRFGCQAPGIFSVFITHQVNILMPPALGWLHPVVASLNRSFINRFDRCWIPDYPGSPLAGKLASVEKAEEKSKVRYTGPLSRFVPSEPTPPICFDVAVVLSGPEPQRTVLERRIVPQLEVSGLRYKVVRGIPGDSESLADKNVINFLGSEELKRVIESSAIVIARSGYSTVMDMQALGKRVIFVPTPGQTEQQYLARRFHDSGVAYACEQESFCLQKALKESQAFRGFNRQAGTDLLSAVIAELLAVAAKD